ncbi:MAG: response regulator [Deinococcales bacterium]|nr:response regulator [Deinococcales bacterium]
MLLSVEGYEVAMVEDGKAALEHLKDNTPDLAILDVKMPYLSGIEVCRRMKRIPRLKHVPVIILTALRDETTLRDAREQGADEVILKPLEGKDFRETVKRLVAASRAARDGDAPA